MVIRKPPRTPLPAGEGSTFNSATAKQLQKPNNVTCHAEFISASSHHQAITTPEIPNDHLQEHTGGQILKQVQDNDVACGRIKKVVSAHCSQKVGCAGVRTLLSLYYCCSAKKIAPYILLYPTFHFCATLKYHKSVIYTKSGSLV